MQMHHSGLLLTALPLCLNQLLLQTPYLHRSQLSRHCCLCMQSIIINAPKPATSRTVLQCAAMGQKSQLPSRHVLNRLLFMKQNTERFLDFLGFLDCEHSEQSACLSLDAVISGRDFTCVMPTQTCPGHVAGFGFRMVCFVDVCSHNG